MSNQRKHPQTGGSGKKAAPEERSSQGNNSVAQTPKDVASDEAASRDVKERKIASTDPEEREQEQLDDAVESTFPASDPLPATGGVTRVEVPKNP